jgi:hypothetical protein
MEEQQRRYTLADILQRYTLDDLFREQEVLRVKDNVAIIDELLEDLEAEIGRKLSEDETSAVLDIVDEYTPKDNKGNYLVELLPFDYAWEIYQAKIAL